MRDLAKWQVVSFVSRTVAMLLGIVQSIVIVRILSVSEYGLVSIVVSIGSAFGVYQHLGLASGSTREISSAKDDSEVFKIFVTSTFIRYFVSIPLAIVLFSLSKYIAVAQYASPAMVTPIRLFSLVLLIQGMQGIFNSVISGTQRFKQLFVYQMVIAGVSLFVYIPLIYFFGVNGYFVALAVFNLIGSISLGIIALGPLKGKFVFPKKDDFKRLLKDILSISLGIYVVKIIYTYWQRSGPLLLGLSISPEEVGLFSFALLYSAKLMTVSDAITAVNLPILSRKFGANISEFKELFSSNFDKVFAFIVFAASSAVFWSRELIHVFVGSNKYDSAFPLILPLVLAFVFYSVVNILKSSLIIPAKLVKEMILGFALMLISTVGFYFAFGSSLGVLNSMAYGMVLGSFVGLITFSIVSYIKLEFNFFKPSHGVTFIICLVLSILYTIEFGSVKVFTYLIAISMYLLALFLFGVIKKGHVMLVIGGIKGKLGCQKK